MTGQILDIKLFIPDKTAYTPTHPGEALRELGADLIFNKADPCGASTYEAISLHWRTYDADDPHKGLECLGPGCPYCEAE